MEKRTRWLSMVMFIAVIAILSLFMRGKPTLAYTFNEDGFAIETAEGYTASVAWTDIESVQEVDHIDFGDLVDGYETQKERSGVWNNQTYGTYSLCTDSTVDKYIVLQTKQGVMIINFESDQSTDNLTEAIQKNAT